MDTKLGRLGAAALLVALASACTVAAPASASETDPGRLMLVMDASGSMGEQLPGGGTKIVAARAAMHDLAGSLPADQPVGLRVFGAKASKSSGHACTDSQRVVDPGTGNRPALDAAIDRVRPFGETPIGYALQEAAKDLGSSGQRTVVLVSDGEPTCAPDPCTVAAGLAKAGIAFRVDVVGLAVSGTARSKLQCIAGRGNGHYYDADSTEDLRNALGQVAVRAASPFRTEGKKVTGSNTMVNAPIIGFGDFVDTLGAVGGDRQSLFYRVHRAKAGTTLRASVATPLQGKSDTVQVRILDEDGSSCASDVNTGSSAAYDPILNAGAFAPESQDGSDLRCAAAGDFVVEVDHGYSGTSTIGLTEDIPIELRLREEAAAPDITALPAAVETPAYADPRLTGALVKTAGGDSLASATPLAGGAYSGTLVPGDLQAFAVDLDYGQSLATAVRIAVTPTLGRELQSGDWPTLSVRVLSPTRLDAAGAYRSVDLPNHFRGSGSVYQGSDGRTFYEYTDSIAYRNRFASSSSLQAASEAGRYVIVVSLLNDQGAQRKLAVPFVLGVAVRGQVQGVPAYRTSTAGGSASTDPTTGTVQHDGDSTADGADTAIGGVDLVRQTVAIGAIGVGVLLLVTGGVVLVVLARRRTSA